MGTWHSDNDRRDALVELLVGSWRWLRIEGRDLLDDLLWWVGLFTLAGLVILALARP